MSESLEHRIDFIRQQIKSGEYSSPAIEATIIIENAFRELYRRSIGLLSGADRIKVNQTEIQIGGGSKTLDTFTMGQLVALYRNSGFLKAWSNATGNELRGISMINLDELVSIRNQLHHGDRQATRAEAEMLFQCVQSVLETFGILSLEALTTPTPSPSESPPSDAPSKRKSAPTDSSYTPDFGGEALRLATQAGVYEQFDASLLDSLEGSGSQIVVVDLGCSDGNLTRSRFAADRFAHVLGVDRSSEMIGRAQDQLEENSKFDFVCVDLEKDDLERHVADFLSKRGLSGVDVIFSALTLHHLANPIKLLRTCRYILGEKGAIVVRGSDDGAKMAWPDPNRNVARIIELTANTPGVSDRINGRKLHNQLYRAGFRDIDVRHNVIETSRMSRVERETVFQTSFSYRSDNLQRNVAANPGNRELAQNLIEMSERLEELEYDFEDHAFFYCATDFAAIARAAH